MRRGLLDSARVTIARLLDTSAPDPRCDKHPWNAWSAMLLGLATVLTLRNH